PRVGAVDARRGETCVTLSGRADRAGRDKSRLYGQRGRMTPIPFPSPPRRVLIIKPSAIGDVVHALPVLNLLRRRWSAAQVSWLVTPACAGLLERHPQLDEVIRFDRNQFGRGWRSPRVAWDLVRFMAGLRRR